MGPGLTPTGENMRNPHDMFVTSHGDFLQSDNDDPAHSRSSWVMEHANMGYADLRDGSRSWEEVAKTWEEPQGWSKSRRFLTFSLAGKLSRRLPSGIDLRSRFAYWKPLHRG